MTPRIPGVWHDTPLTFEATIAFPWSEVWMLRHCKALWAVAYLHGGRLHVWGGSDRRITESSFLEYAKWGMWNSNAPIVWHKHTQNVKHTSEDYAYSWTAELDNTSFKEK